MIGLTLHLVAVVARNWSTAWTRRCCNRLLVPFPLLSYSAGVTIKEPHCIEDYLFLSCCCCLNSRRGFAEGYKKGRTGDCVACLEERMQLPQMIPYALVQRQRIELMVPHQVSDLVGGGRYWMRQLLCPRWYQGSIVEVCGAMHLRICILFTITLPPKTSGLMHNCVYPYCTHSNVSFINVLKQITKCRFKKSCMNTTCVRSNRQSRTLHKENDITKIYALKIVSRMICQDRVAM